VAMLESRSLYFARADHLGDQFEGAAGVAERRPDWDAFYLDFFRNAVRTIPGRTEPPPPEQVEQEAARLLEDIRQIGEQDRRRTFVSCWHANGVESEALWRLYCPPPTMGVAIQTTVGLLANALDKTWSGAVRGFSQELFRLPRPNILEAEIAGTRNGSARGNCAARGSRGGWGGAKRRSSEDGRFNCRLTVCTNLVCAVGQVHDGAVCRRFGRCALGIVRRALLLEIPCTNPDRVRWPAY
jgi:hypothetical protein